MEAVYWQGSECIVLQKQSKEKFKRFAFFSKVPTLAVAVVCAVCVRHCSLLTFGNGQVKTGIQLDSDLTNKDRLADAVFELSTAAPKCLTGVINPTPALLPPPNTRFLSSFFAVD